MTPTFRWCAFLHAGLEAIEWTSDRDRPTNTNRGFCFLDYKNHQCAQAALRVLTNDFQYVLDAICLSRKNVHGCMPTGLVRESCRRRSATAPPTTLRRA